MKKFLEKVISLVLVLLVVFGSMSFAMQNKAFSATTLNCPNYTINGITVNEDSVEHKGSNGCVKYARAMYKILWGVEYNNKFVGDSETGYNMLCELPGEERKITAEKAQKYISQAALGAVIRTEDTDTSADGNEGTGGHSLIVVEITQDGFTALENWSSKTVTQKYTWEEFASSDGNGSFHAYFKYIKWPGAHVYSEVETGKCGENVTYTFDKSTGTLTIGGTGEMTNWSNVYSIPWFDYRAEIKTVIIGNSVTSVGESAFLSCNELASVTIGNNVTSIGESAFYYCASLTSITIPYTAVKIGWNAFYNTAYYNDNNNWKNGVLYIENHLIEARTTISGVYEIEEGTKTISAFAFRGCDALTRIIIPDSVASIGEYAFNNCTSLISATIPDSVTSIGEHAFSRCTSLENIIISDSVIYIGESVFNSCIALTSVTVGSSVTDIGDYAFYNCDSLTTISIGDSVTSIGKEAFYGCDALANMTIPDSVTSIGDRGFQYCTGLASVTIGNSVTKIGEAAFYGCVALTSITIPDSVTSIDNVAFGYCTELTSITIGNSVKNIGDYAFEICTSLTDVYFMGSKKEWNEITIGVANECLTNATIHYEKTEKEPTFFEKVISFFQQILSFFINLFRF